jgi:hypothetical protein
MSYGVLHFHDPRTFDAPLQLEEALDALAVQAHVPLATPVVDDWPQLFDCIARGSGYAVEARTPAFSVRLAFDPATQELGDYEIHFSGRQPERGRVVRIAQVPEDELWRHEYSGLRAFPVRFDITTTAPHVMQRDWLVGILATRGVIEDEPENA